MKPKDENKVQQIYLGTLRRVRAGGIAGLTMQAVAREAKIATGTLYIYFSSKEVLLVSLFHECVKNSATGFFRDYDPAEPFKVGFRKIWSNILHHRISNFEEMHFIEQFFTSPYIDEETKIKVKKIFDPLRNLIQRGKDEHLIKDVDSFWLIAFMTGNINEVVKRVIYFNKKLTPEIEELNFQFCWDGIKA